MSRAVEESNRHMLRARDAMDRDYAHEPKEGPIEVPPPEQIAAENA